MAIGQPMDSPHHRQLMGPSDQVLWNLVQNFREALSRAIWGAGARARKVGHEPAPGPQRAAWGKRVKAEIKEQLFDLVRVSSDPSLLPPAVSVLLSSRHWKATPVTGTCFFGAYFFG